MRGEIVAETRDQNCNLAPSGEIIVYISYKYNILRLAEGNLNPVRRRPAIVSLNINPIYHYVTAVLSGPPV